jgi:hypothetical protein
MVQALFCDKMCEHRKLLMKLIQKLRGLTSKLYDSVVKTVEKNNSNFSMKHLFIAKEYNRVVVLLQQNMGTVT